MGRDLKEGCADSDKESAIDFLLSWKYSFKFFGVVLDCHRSSHDHIKESRRKAVKRLAILRGVGDTTCGREGRILSVTVHDLLNSRGVLSCHTDLERIQMLHSRLVAKEALKITSTGFTIRGKILRFVAETETTTNRYIF